MGSKVNPGDPASWGRREDSPCTGRPKGPYRSRETELDLATGSLLFVGLSGDHYKGKCFNTRLRKRELDVSHLVAPLSFPRHAITKLPGERAVAPKRERGRRSQTKLGSYLWRAGGSKPVLITSLLANRPAGCGRALRSAGGGTTGRQGPGAGPACSAALPAARRSLFPDTVTVPR